MNNVSCIIPLSGLKASAFDWTLDGDFFKSFGNEEIIKASISVSARAVRNGASIDVDCAVKGILTVPCDRCLEDLDMDVDTTASLRLRFGSADTAEDIEEDGREVIAVEEGESEWDLSQVIYDYACLALPIQRCHPEGLCNSETVSRLSSENQDAPADADNPFAALKGLF